MAAPSGSRYTADRRLSCSVSHRVRDGSSDARQQRRVRRHSETAFRSPAAPRTPTPFAPEAFADISDDPVPDEVAVKLQAILDGMNGGGGMAATVMSVDGTWSGATGKADGVRDVQVLDQFGIASITKSVVAAQVMQMVEAGELGLDDLAADHLPPDLDFDSNGATIRELLMMRAGIPDWYDDAMQANVAADRQRFWTTDEVLDLVKARTQSTRRQLSNTRTPTIRCSVS